MIGVVGSVESNHCDDIMLLTKNRTYSKLLEVNFLCYVKDDEHFLLHSSG